MPEYALRLAAICSGEFIKQRRYYVIREMVQELRHCPDALLAFPTAWNDSRNRACMSSTCNSDLSMASPELERNGRPE